MRLPGALLVACFVVPTHAFELWLGASSLSGSAPESQWISRKWLDGLSVDFKHGAPDPSSVQSRALEGFTLVACAHANLETSLH